MLRETWRFIKAQLSSGMATFLDWAVLSSLILFGVHYIPAICAGALVGAVTDFALKRAWALGKSGRGLKQEAGRYAAVSATSAGLNCALAFLLIEKLAAPKVRGALAASVVVGFLWNYPMHRLYVFGRATSKV